MKTSICLLAALMAASPAWGMQDEQAVAPTTATESVASAAAVSPADQCHCVPAGTLIELEIDQLLSSASHKRGDRFAIKLHAPLAHDGFVLIPAGTVGVGEIIHAERSRGGGKPGELLIAARHLVIEDVQVPLRGLKLGGQGKDNTQVALGTSFAIGPFAHFIRGREIEIPVGTVVTAKLAKDFPVRMAEAGLSTETMSATTSITSPPTPAPSASTHKE